MLDLSVQYYVHLRGNLHTFALTLENATELSTATTSTGSRKSCPSPAATCACCTRFSSEGALAGTALPRHVQGTSLLPLVNGQAREIRGEIFAEVNYHACYEPQRCIRTPRFKYILGFDQRQNPLLPNSDDSPTKDLLMDHGWGQRTLEREQLYDLVFDPHETRTWPQTPIAGIT